MPCYRPQPAVRLADGTVKFVSRDHPRAQQELTLPCGQCVGCRLERSRQWAVRCMHEARLHEQNCFVTLTYEDAHLPPGESLNYEHFQLFMKRLRKFLRKPVRFYMCGEYGEQLSRPHYHFILFGHDFADKKYFKKTSVGEKIYVSADLDKIWGKGHCSIGAVTFESAAYIARYCVQKVNGDLADKHYEVITQDGEVIKKQSEFNHMSLKPGIGSGFFSRFFSDIYPRDFVVVRGVKQKPPKYYDKLLDKSDPDLLESLRWQREMDMQALQSDNPDEFLRGYYSSVSGQYNNDRLQVKENFTNINISNFKRNLGHDDAS